MPSMPSLTRNLQAAYPDFTFKEAELFSWSPDTRTVQYNPSLPDAPFLLLHELSHALLGHQVYLHDVELVAMEAAAWQKAKECAGEYDMTIPESVIEDHLDTYRDWMHARSTCPECSANGYQAGKAEYRCPACGHRWRVNEARLCALRRYSDL